MGGILGGVASMYDSFYGNKARQRESLNAQEDMMDEQFANMQSMFPFSNMITDKASAFFDENMGNIFNYLEKPMKPSNLERQLFEFFGGEAPGKERGSKNQRGLFKRYGAESGGPLSGKGVPMLEELTGLLQSLVPSAQEWGETGFKTDIQPIQDYAMRMFEREMMPEVAERFGGNIAGSGFNREMGRTMGDVTSELGAMEVALQEAASGRRMQGLSGPIQGIFSDPLRANAEFATAGAQAGQMYRNAVDNARPAKGMLAALPMFTGIEQGGTGFIQQGFPTSGTDFGNMASALGGAGAQLGGGIAELFQMFGNNNGGGGSLFNDWDASLGYSSGGGAGGSGGPGPLSGFLGGDWNFGGGGGVEASGDLSSVMDWGSFGLA